MESYETLKCSSFFWVRSVDKEIYVTTDGFHYSSILKEASHILVIRIKRQRCVKHFRVSSL